jgi:rhomboid protease GluP
MKAQFIEGLIRTLIRDRDFLLLKDRNGAPVISLEHTVLIKEHLGNAFFVELLDGDGLSGREIAARLQHNNKFLTENKINKGLFFFAVFIFSSQPDGEKLAAITAGQFQDRMSKTFLKCLTVNLAAKSAQRHFDKPIADIGLTETITKLFTGKIPNLVGDGDLLELVTQKEQEYKITLQSNIPVITYVLIGINIIVWSLLTLYSKTAGLSYNQLIIDFGAKENLRILSGEYWRFLTPIFLHANLFHLLINCYSLNAVGVLVEKIFGRYRFGIVYLCAGIMGNILSFIFSFNPGVGASGSIFGLLGALLYFGLIKPALFKSHFGYNIILTILLNLGYGFTITGIDNSAHIGGLIGGFLTSGAVLPSKKKRWYTNRLFYLCFTLVLALSGLIYGFNNTQNKIVIKINELEKLDRAENWARVESKAEEILRLKPGNKSVQAYTLWTLAKAQALSGKYSEALVSAKELTLVDPANGHYLQGLFYYDTGQYALAREELEQAKRAGAKYEMINKLLREINSLEK